MRTINAIFVERVRSRSFGEVMMRVLNAIDIRLERQRSRRDLLELTDEQLKDIGLSRSQAHEEAYRPLWD
ncbi:DUF1127 domain-containing protein [Tianweitania populi]|uniref:YjiS-like domain-containing protein n=1 Tax=Tianweitania populi TaxID=1607949 RepID=A0A8J3DNQ8_9HYPH|nr:DUF1127 domain-containing protein [Tianweitania populi]GHD09903.1 hypothetical protein GCM10016234_11120 [Tianweitania populi]